MVQIKEKLFRSITKAQSYIYTNQQYDGRWEGTIYYNAYPTAVMLITNKILGIKDEKVEHKAIEWIESNQDEDGSWSIIDRPQKEHPYLTESDLTDFLEVKASRARNTAVCCLAIELYQGSTITLEKAEKYLLSVDKSLIDPFTQILMAYFNKIDWGEIKIPPIEVLLFPNNCKFGICRVIPVWIRDAAVGALLFKTLVERKHTYNPLRRLAINKAIKMLHRNQLPNGSWFGTFQPTVYPMLAFSKLGENKSTAFMKGLEFIKNRCNRENGYVHRFNLSNWDTGLTLISLLESTKGKVNKSISKGIGFLQNSKLQSGNWGFAPEITLYPDCDDTAIITRAILESGIDASKLRNTARWLIKMQNKDGGWSAFTKNQAKKQKGTLPTTIEDSLVILKDPSVADITGHVIYVLAKLGYSKSSKVIRNGIKFLVNDQLDNGSWYGRWGLCYIYGTTRVLNCLHILGHSTREPFVDRAINWLLSKQNQDGGWGEHYIAYFKESCGGVGRSTPCQTGWVVETLSRLIGTNHYAVKRGVDYLLGSQKTDGNWDSPITVGALEIYENTNYSSIFPLLGLSVYLNNM